MKTLHLIASLPLFTLICVTLVSCNGGSKTWTTYKDHNFIIDDMAFRITEKGAVLVCVNPDHAGHLEIPDQVLWEENGVTYPVIDIQEYGLNNCKRITSVKVPNTVADISWVFGGCTSLVSVNVPTKSNRMVGAFCGCTSLKEIEIPDNVGYIGGAFEGCSRLANVTLPQNEEFTYILGGTFAGCRELTSITIPSHVQYIYKGSFEGCDKLTAVHCQSVEAPDAVDEGNLYHEFFAVADTLYVPEGSLESYQQTEPWSDFLTILEE